MITKEVIIKETLINLGKEGRGLMYESNLKTHTFNRLLRWFHYFNCNYSYFIIIYHRIIAELASMASSCDFFKNQTQYEFELSLKFFDLIKRSKTTIMDSEYAKIGFLIKFSIIFSKYPGMLIRSPEKIIIKTFKEALKHNYGVLSGEILVNLFNQLYVRYESPHFLIVNLDKLTLTEAEALMFILQGNNIRNFEKLEIPISRKESYLIMNKLPCNLIKGKNLILKAVLCGKLLNIHKVDNEFVLRFLKESKEFEFRTELFHKRLNFWKQAISLLSKIDFRTSRLRLTSYIDYFEYKLSSENDNYSLKGRTTNSVTRAINKWYEEQFNRRLNYTEELSWPRTTEKDIEIKVNDNSYKFKELTCSQDLLQESKQLEHCVRVYAKNCHSKYITIFSMQKLVDGQYKSKITIEIKNKIITQIGGKRNRYANMEELEIINKWSNEVGFYLEDYSYPYRRN